MLSYAGHLLLSLALHVAGVTAGLTIWYLFPRNVSFDLCSLYFDLGSQFFVLKTSSQHENMD